jgi:CRISPR system Cascade subunit CasE
MPYLSKIRVNPMRESGRVMLANPHRVHAMIQQGIATQPVTERTLWRWENTGNTHQAQLLVLTETRPDWSHIAEQAGWPHADGEHFTIRDYQPLFDHLAIGREFAFKLTANPVQNTQKPVKPSPQQAARLTREGRKRGERLGHRTAVQQVDWLIQRAMRNGFAIPEITLGLHPDQTHTEPVTAPDLRLTSRDRLRFWKHNSDDTPPITLATATYEGRLAVTDVSLLRNALLSGIGPSKAYGCGLLTLAPLVGARSA